MKKNKFLIMLIMLVTVFVTSMTAFGCSCTPNGSPNTVDVVFDGYLSSNTVNIGVDETFKLNALNTKIKEWSSSNTDVATVSSDGIITGKATGIAFISAVSEEGQTFCCIVTVKTQSSAFSIELTEKEYYMGVDDVFTLTADVVYEASDLDDTVTWSVSNDQICSIETHGNQVEVTGKSEGETFVVASLDGEVAQCKLIVREQKTNDSSFVNIPSEMETAKMTKNYYELGRLNNSSTQDGASSTIYETVIYEKTSDKYTIVAFATLSDGKNDLNWTTENYFAYGIYLKTIQVHDADKGMESADRVYYAYNGTDESGKYGIEVDNVPNGYFAIYSFVEYIENGKVVREISSERVLVGDYNAKLINSTSDFRVFMIDRKWGAGGVMAGYETKVIEKTEVYDKEKSKYAIEAPAMYHYLYTQSGDVSRQYKIFPSVMVKAQTIMTKEMLEEALGDGISVVRFKVCYRTDSEKVFNGSLITTNFDVLDSTFPKQATDLAVPGKPETAYGGVNASNAAFDEYVNKASTTRTAVNNKWYTIEYKVKDLIEDYDVYFGELAEYPFFTFNMLDGKDNEAGDNAGVGRVLISEPEFVNIPYDDMFSEEDMYSFVLARNGDEGDATWKYLSTSTSNSRRCNGVEAESGQDIMDFEDASGVTKEVAYKFKYTYISYEQSGATEDHVYEEIKREQVNKGRYLLMAFENSRISKSLLEELLTLGYEKLSFSIVVDDYGRANTLRVKTIDFDYLRANPDKTLMSTDRYGLKVNDDAFKATNVTVNQARNWYTISYEIKDLIEFFDQIFGCPKLLLAQAWTDYTEGTTSQDQYPYYYITKVGFKKGINFDGAEDMYPDIFD